MRHSEKWWNTAVDLKGAFFQLPIYGVKCGNYSTYPPPQTYNVQAYRAAIKDFITAKLDGLDAALEMTVGLAGLYMAAVAVSRSKPPPLTKQRSTAGPSPTYGSAAASAASTASASGGTDPSTKPKSLAPVPPGTCKGNSWFEHCSDPTLRPCYYCIHYKLHAGTYVLGDPVPADCWHVKTGSGKFDYVCPVKDGKDGKDFRYYHKRT
jgi:hypothetical protein